MNEMNACCVSNYLLPKTLITVIYVITVHINKHFALIYGYNR